MVRRQRSLENLVMKSQMNFEFWKKQRVFVTGNTGFKGSWLTMWLKQMGAEVLGYGLEPDIDDALFSSARLAEEYDTIYKDIRDLTSLSQSLYDFAPTIIFHLAAQPIVKASYVDPVETYSVNVLGTANLLQAAREVTSLKAIINVTTDKCYENNEWVWGYRETDQLGGHDPYSSSKACSELVTRSYRDCYFRSQGVGVATARSGNVVGGGDWCSHRLIPDFFRAIHQGEFLQIRNPNSQRPWQYVLEPLSGYLMLAEHLTSDPEQFSGSWNFGPKLEDARSVEYIVRYLSNKTGSQKWKFDQKNHEKEAQLLFLDTSKARSLLNWKTLLNLDETLNLCSDWYLGYFNGMDVQEKCTTEIAAYVNLLDAR